MSSTSDSELTEEKFALKVRTATNCIASGRRNTECGNILRELYRHFSLCIQRKFSFSDELLKQLKSLIVEPGNCPKALRLLGVSLLRDLAPTVDYSVKVSNLSADPNWLPLVFPLILVQGQELGYIEDHVPIFFRWLKSSPNAAIQRNSLLCLNSIHNYHGIQLFTEEQVFGINQFMHQWLSKASCVSAPNPYQRKLFNSKQKLQAVTELDGRHCDSFFTVLNLSHYCTIDQWLNIYTFSVLRQWLLNTWEYQGGFGEISLEIPLDINSIRTESAGSVTKSLVNEPLFLDNSMFNPAGFDDMYREVSQNSSSTPLPSSSSPILTEVALGEHVNTPVRDIDDITSLSSYGNLSSMQKRFGSESSFFSESQQDGSLVQKAMSYCYRLLQQNEHKPKNLTDSLLQKACLIEAVTLLDFFCYHEKDLVPKAIQAVRKVYGQVKTWPGSWVDAILPILLFYINHGEAVILDAEPYVRYFFSDVLFNSFTSPEIAFEIVSFCRENKEKLRQSTNVFSKYFPNIFKIIAWFPRTFLKEFLELLPVMISEKNYIEIFHLLLDLPCLSAALETVKEAGKRVGAASENLGPCRIAVDAYKNVKYKALFAFILRRESGMADTIDKLDVLHSVFEDLVEFPRVLICSQVSWLLLKVYFREIFHNKDIVEKKLFSIILERVVSLINIESYKENIQSLLASQLSSLFKRFPSLLLEHVDDVIQYIHQMKSLDEGFENFFTSLVWIIGEYASSKYDVNFDTSIIIKFHEAVESVTYELALKMNSRNAELEDFSCSSRLVCVLMSTLAKLASRCPDLIPKVVLCIRKVSKQRVDMCIEETEKETVISRASELITLLSKPSIATLILTPDPSIKEGRLHRDRHTSLSFFMNASKDMMFPS